MKTILITGSTDGIGLETARLLTSLGHRVVLHGRTPAKLEKTQHALGVDRGHVADLSRLDAVERLADEVIAQHGGLDVLINNAGVYGSPGTSSTGPDPRFLVNTIAPYLLTRRLLGVLSPRGRVVNLSSAAQAPVDRAALTGPSALPDFEAYAQSKLALTAWSVHLGRTLGPDGPVIVAVNPGSMLGSKMVKDAFGVDGADLGIGAEILRRAALDASFAEATGLYFDNDAGRFAPPHPEARDPAKCAAIVAAIDRFLAAR